MDNLKEKLHDAGIKFDGHVTHGSLEEQMKVIKQYESSVIMRFRKMLDRIGIHGYYNEMQKEFPED